MKQIKKHALETNNEMNAVELLIHYEYYKSNRNVNSEMSNNLFNVDLNSIQNSLLKLL